MRFLNAADLHITSKRPSSRIDNFEETIYKKLYEVGRLAQQHKVDAVILSGDIFHSPKVNMTVAITVAKLFRSWNVDIYSIIGNHDIFGYNPKTLNQTMLGLFVGAGIIKLLDRDNPLVFNHDDQTIKIEGQHYYADIDKGNPADYQVAGDADYNVLITHAMMLDRPFIDGVPHTVISNIETKADLIISGHYHPGVKYQVCNGTKYYNPGSLIRVEASRFDKPKVALFDSVIRDGKVDLVLYEIPLSTSMPHDEVFIESKKEEKQEFNNIITDFKENVDKLSELKNTSSLEETVKELDENKELDESITKLVMEEVQKAQIENSDKAGDYTGYDSSNVNIKMTEINIKNFQSHEDTSIALLPTDNIMCGESGSGKTAIERAIRFCLFDEPKGNKFIRRGTKECSVEIKFSNGTALKRIKSMTSTGKYIVTNEKGEETEFKGFGTNPPIEIANTHKAPKIELIKGKKVSINFATQLESSFLLSETPLSKAEAIGRLTGANILDLSKKNLNKKILGINKEIKALEAKRVEKSEKLVKYCNLNKVELLILKIDKLSQDKVLCETRIAELCKKLDDYKKLSDKLAKVRGAKSTVQSKIKSEKYIETLKVDIDTLKNSVSKLEIISKQYANLSSTKSKIASTKSNLNKVEHKLTSKHLVADLKSGIEKLDIAVESRSNRVKIFLAKKRLSNTINENEKKFKYKNTVKACILKVDKLIDISDKNTKLENKISDKNELNYVINKNNINIAKLANEIKVTKEKIKDLIDNTEKCPVCNSILKYDSVMGE